MGSKVNNNYVGNFGDAALFSIDHSKPINSFTGGIIYSTNDYVYNNMKIEQEASQSLSLKRQKSIYKRFLNKLFYKQKKVFTSRGIVIAISGVDGSGKSTMLEELKNVFGKFVTIRSFHLGKPQGKFIEFIWRAMGNRSSNASMAGTSSNNLPSSKARAFNGMILALMRLRLAKSIIKLSRKGGLMVTDRWPTNELGKMDGPRIVLGKDSGWLESSCKKIETWAYDVMPRADICYFFEVPIEIPSRDTVSKIESIIGDLLL